MKNQKEILKLLDQDIESIAAREDFSTRTKNILRDNKIAKAEDLLRFYLANDRSFLSFPKAGKLVNMELGWFCEPIVKKYGIQALQWYLAPQEKTENKADIPAYLSLFEKRTKLSVRANTVISDLLIELNQSVEELIDKLYSPEFDVASLPKCGAKTARKLKPFFANIKKAALVFALDQVSNPVLFRLLVGECKLPPLATRDFLEKEGYSYSSLMILAVKSFRLNHSISTRDWQIFLLASNVEISMSNAAIAKEFKLSGERARQISGSMIEIIENYFDDFWKKVIPGFSQGMIPMALKNDIVHISTVLSLFSKSIWPDDQPLLDFAIASLLRLSHHEFKRQNGFKLYILNEFATRIKFEELEGAIENRKVNKAYRTFPFQLPEVIEAHTRLGGNDPLVPRLAAILDVLLTDVYGLVRVGGAYYVEVPDLNFKVKKAIHNLLLRQQTPMHYSAIQIKVEETLGLQSLDSEYFVRMVSESQAICSLGKSGYYILEKHHPNIPKFGPWMTFIEILKKMLKDRIEPVHISEIEKFINQYRQASRVSILNTLETINDRKIVSFPGYFYGLAKRNYPKTDFVPVPGSLYRSVDMIIRDSKKGEVSVEILTQKIAKRYNLLEVQIQDWLENRSKAGKIVIQNGMVSLPG